MDPTFRESILLTQSGAPTSDKVINTLITTYKNDPKYMDGFVAMSKENVDKLPNIRYLFNVFMKLVYQQVRFDLGIFSTNTPISDETRELLIITMLNVFTKEAAAFYPKFVEDSEQRGGLKVVLSQSPRDHNHRHHKKSPFITPYYWCNLIGLSLRRVLLAFPSTGKSANLMVSKFLDCINVSSKDASDDLFELCQNTWIVHSSSVSDKSPQEKETDWENRMVLTKLAISTSKKRWEEKYARARFLPLPPLSDPTTMKSLLGVSQIDGTNTIRFEHRILKNQEFEELGNISKLVFDGVNFELSPETLKLDRIPLIRSLTFKNIHRIPLHQFPKSILENVTTIHFESCTELEFAVYFPKLKTLTISKCDRRLMQKITTTSCEEINVESDTKIRHILASSPVSTLKLENCTGRYIYKTLHSKKSEGNLIPNLRSLLLWWKLDINFVNRKIKFDPQKAPYKNLETSKQLHLNRFRKLQELTIKNYPVDAIACRNPNSTVEKICIFTRNPCTLPNFIRKFTNPNMNIRIYIEDVFDRSQITDELIKFQKSKWIYPRQAPNTTLEHYYK